MSGGGPSRRRAVALLKAEGLVIRSMGPIGPTAAGKTSCASRSTQGKPTDPSRRHRPAPTRHGSKASSREERSCVTPGRRRDASTLSRATVAFGVRRFRGAPSPTSLSPTRRACLCRGWTSAGAHESLLLVLSITGFRRGRRFRFHASRRLLAARPAASISGWWASAPARNEASRRSIRRCCRDSSIWAV